MPLDKDNQVIDFMFDPFLIEYSFTDELPNDNSGIDSHNLVDLKSNKNLSEEQLKSKKLEHQAIELSNQGKHEEALNCFEQSLKLWPKNASVLNNRAQTYRLLNRIEEAMDDLNRSIELLNDDVDDGKSLSENNQQQQKNFNNQVARQAYCQRALIHLLNENKEQGLKDMKKSADLGNRFARSYMAKMNPYAALCNQMLQDMFQQYTKMECKSKPSSSPPSTSGST